MAITASDIVKYLTGAGSDGGTQADPSASLGDYRSSTTVTDNSDNNLFDDVSGSEASDGDTEYRCICIKNTHGSLELQDAKVYLQEAAVGSGNSIEFAVETPATASLTDGNAQSVADESTAPTVNTTGHNGTGSGISAWSTATSYSGGVPVSQGDHDANMGVGEIIFVWIKRVIGSGASAATGVDFTIRVEGDSAA
jgi:hypothetical protein